MRVLVTGSRGTLGRQITAALRARGPETTVIEAHRGILDLSDLGSTRDFVAATRPDAIIHAAAYVRGIQARLDHPERFLVENLRIDDAVFSAATQGGVSRLLYFSSAGIYPQRTHQPIREDGILTGSPEPALESYAIAKIAGTKRCEYVRHEFGFDYSAVIPSNLYGPGDHLGATGAHLIAAALQKADHAKNMGLPSIEVWGDGSALREFTYAADLAAWVVDVVVSGQGLPAAVNVGSGDERTIREYHEMACEVVGYGGDLVFDTTKPSGAPRRLLDSSLARSAGWEPTTSLIDGMTETYRDLVSRLNGE